MKLFPVLFFACILIRSLSAQALPAGVEHLRTVDGIEEYRLIDNNLRVLLLPQPNQPVTTVMVTYQVGARNEVTGTTGATHILEHMMFKGTERFNSAAGNDYSSQMERIGARSNATTYFDRTNYYATLPSQYVPLAIELEADRMRNLRIREEDLASEMTVVRNEYERGENNPVSTLIKEIYAAAFVAHPYSHPTIGWRSDIESTSPEKLREFYNTFYWPENAVLTLIGGFDRFATLQAVVQHYGPIPNAPHPIPELTTREPEQLGPRHLIIERSGQIGVVMVAFKSPAGTHQDWAALALLEQLLGADKTGRLYRALEDKGKASSAFTFAPQLRDPSLFILAAYLTPDANHEETEAIILDEINALINGGVAEDELVRAKAVVQASTIYGRDGSYAIADQINETIAMGDWTQYISLPKAIQAVSAEDLQRVAKKYFIRSNRTTGWFVPQSSQSASTGSNALMGPNYYRDPAVYGPQYNSESADAAPLEATTPQVDFSSIMQQATTSNGIELIAIDMPIQGVVSFAGSLAAGETLSPADAPALAGLTAAMLDKGTSKQDRFALAEQLDRLGADIGFAAGPHTLGFSGRFLRNDAGSIMQLLAEQLRQPAFDPEVLKTVKSRQIARLLQAMDNTDYRASAETSRLLYPQGHPNYSAPLEELMDNVEATRVEAIRAFHADHYGPKSMRLVFAGDIDFEQLVAAVENAFESWNAGVDYPSDAPAARSPEAKSERIYIADKTSVSVHYGYPTGLSRTDPDYIPFMIGNYILGGSFQSRLMSEVRKKRGLTYSIRTGHQGDIFSAGHWLLSASFGPSQLEQGLSATDAVIADWYESGVTQDEVQAALATLSGSYLVNLTTTSSVAGQVLSFIERGFAPEYIDAYPKHLQATTTEQVNAAIKAHFNPELSVQVIAGSLETAEIPNPPKDQQSITVRIDCPNPSWHIKIEAVYRKSDRLIVVSQLAQNAASSAQVITTLSDTVQIAGTAALPVEHYILGKTWDWGQTPEQTYLQAQTDLDPVLKDAELLFRSAATKD
jgi:zinc protease